MRQIGYRSARCGCTKQAPLCPAEALPCARPSAHMDEWEYPLWDHQLARNWMRLASDNCRWWDVLTDTSAVLTLIIMQIQIDKWRCFLLRIRDCYLYFTVMHISWFCSCWFVAPGYSETARICCTACQNYWWLLVEKLWLKVRGRWVSRSPQSWHLQPCSPE